MSRFWKQQRLFLQPISHQDLSILGASCCRRERFWLIGGSAGSWRHRIHLSPLPPLLQISSKFSQIFWKFAKLCEVSPLFRLCLRSDPEESVGIHPSWSGWQLSPRPLSISWLQISQNPPVAPLPAPSGRSLRNGARHWKPLFFATILVTLASVLSALSLSSRCHKGSTMNRQQGIDPTYIAISIFPGVRDRMGMLSRVWSRRGCLHQLPQPRLLCFLSQLDFSRRWGEFILKQKCSSSK